jgi:hypothetical protein
MFPEGSMVHCTEKKRQSLLEAYYVTFCSCTMRKREKSRDNMFRERNNTTK